MKTLNNEEVKTIINFFKPSDSGKYGKAFEVIVKTYCNGNRGNAHKVALKGHKDMIFHGKRYEVKSNCGEINDDIMKNDYIIYTMDNESACYNLSMAVVMTPNQFVSLFDSLGLIRTKTSTAGMKKTTIQSYKNSKRKTALLASALGQFETVEQWVLEH